mgnify:CR=1 FL=1
MGSEMCIRDRPRTAWGSPSARPGSPAGTPFKAAEVHLRELANMQKELAVTNATVRLLHESRRDDESRYTQRALVGRSDKSFSQLWQEDLIERQMRETERRRHEARLESGRGFTRGVGASDRRQPVPGLRPRIEEDLIAAQERNRVLQMELMRLREEKSSVEAEALAFKQRMESAVISFEGIIEKSVEEKTRAFQQLLVVKQQLQASRQQLRVFGGDGAGQRRMVLQRLLRMLDRADGLHAWRVWRRFIDGEAEHERMARLARLEESHEHTVAMLKRRHSAEAREISAQLDSEIEELTSRLKEQQAEMATVRERAVGAERARAGLQDELDLVEQRLKEAELALERSASMPELMQLRARVAELEDSLAAAEQRAVDAAISTDFQARSKGELAHRMLHEQQLELRDGRAMSAVYKLLAATGASSRLSAAHAIAAWRRACVTIEAQEMCSIEAAREARMRATEEARQREEHQEREGVMRAEFERTQEHMSNSVDLLSRRVHELEESLHKAERLAAERADRLHAAERATSKHSLLRTLVCEQQEQLMDAHRLSAIYKVANAMGESGRLAATRAIGTWRAACVYLTAQAALQQTSRVGQDLARKASLVARVPVAARMLHEQQEVLEDGFRIAVAFKLHSVMRDSERRSLSGAFIMWRVVSVELHAKEETQARPKKAVVWETHDAEQRASQKVGGMVAKHAEQQMVHRQFRQEVDGKVGLLRQMVHEQQGELHEGYQLAATCKLFGALSRRRTLALAGAICTWRVASVCLMRMTQVLNSTDTLPDSDAATPPAATIEAAGLREQLRLAEDRALAAVAMASRPQQKFKLLQEMLHHQQDELRDGYRLSAGCKVWATLACRNTLTLAGAVSRWRAACARLASEARLLDQLSVPRLQNADKKLNAKMDILQAIVIEQQDELQDSYRLAAGSKLFAALSRRGSLSLALALATWWRACWGLERSVCH